MRAELQDRLSESVLDVLNAKGDSASATIKRTLGLYESAVIVGTHLIDEGLSPKSAGRQNASVIKHFERTAATFGHYHTDVTDSNVSRAKVAGPIVKTMKERDEDIMDIDTVHGWITGRTRGDKVEEWLRAIDNDGHKIIGYAATMVRDAKQTAKEEAQAKKDADTRTPDEKAIDAMYKRFESGAFKVDAKHDKRLQEMANA